ncbi:hypothetical protein RB195_018051 [Necator americanus]|uniref:C2H2-type domain-containing protein n=1 Tax=Necator americanus TaxID=51031 RepID=A0ABR1C9Z8_NECAM
MPFTLLLLDTETNNFTSFYKLLKVKLEVKKKASSSKPIPEVPCMYCPICDEGFTDHESMACHCEDNHSEDEANGKPQDYTVLLLTFDTVGEFENIQWTIFCDGSKGTTQRRSWFVDRSDLWNLTTKFGLRPGYRDKNGMNSLMHRQAEENADDGIRVLEVTDDPSGRGFRLIMITPTQLEWLRKFSPRGIAVDDTHNVTRYNLKLATVSVADNKNRGLPAAFLLSGTMTTLDVQRLFLEIKKLLPDFNPQQIARIRGQVKKDLNELLLIADLTLFESRFGQILGFLETKGQTGMVNYLKDNYLGKYRTVLASLPFSRKAFTGRTASWASFANTGAVMDTTMISERWHLRLKKDFLHRNANSRADFLVELLIRAVEDLADSAEIRDLRRLAASSFRVQQSSKCDRWALKHYENRPEKMKRVAEWELQGKDVAEKYQVLLG